MTARRRILPLDQVKEVFDFLEARGIDVKRSGVDIGADYVKVLPPANSNTGDDLEQYINRNPLRSQKGAAR